MGRLVVLAGAAMMLAACQPESASDQPGQADVNAGTEQSPAATASQATADKPSLSAAGRAELLAAFARAADATAAGGPLPDANRQLVGRTFSLRLPFGCNGPANKAALPWAGWTYDPTKQTLKLTVTPERWSEAAWVRAIAGEMPYEALEGFWIQRPWTSSEECPLGISTSTEAVATEPVRPTVGIAQFFAPDAPRTFQRGARAYSHTIRVPGAEALKGRGYRLSIGGRVTGFADGQPIHCWNEAPALRPVCLMAVELARVAFEDAPAGVVLVEWRN